MKKIIAKIDKMHCASCAMRIDGDLEELRGVKKSQTNFAKAESEIEYDETKVSEENIRSIVKNAGYEIAQIRSN